MSESRQEQVQEEAMSPAGPGRRLRERREALGLSLDDVSHELRLNPKLVRALEEDDYEHLPPAAFVAGYLRNYARLVELPEQQIVDSYEQAGAKQPELVPYGKDTQVRASDLPVRLVTWALVIGLAVLLGLWWFSEGQPPETPVEETAETEVLPGTEEPVGEGGLETPVEPAIPDTGAEDSQEQPVETETVEEPAEAPAVEEPPAQETAPVAEAQAETTGLQLRLVFTADSWVNISDANGRQLAQGLINEGRELTLDGQPPYRVFLGYAPGVTVYYRGEQFDHSGFLRRNETARFRVGSAGDTPPTGSR